MLIERFTQWDGVFQMRRWMGLAGQAGLAVFTISSAAAGQVPDSARLEDITVTATRIPIARRSLTTSITVLRGADLRARGVATVAEALRTVPGATIVESGSFGGTTSLFLRGGESDYVQVLLDGVVLNDPGGAYDFAHLSTANIDRIEIVRGPASVLYGSEATAGVIQIFTRDGEDRPGITAGVRGGTFDTYTFDAGLGGSASGVTYAFGARYFRSDGIYAFNNQYTNTVASGRVHLRPDDRSDLSFTLRYRDSQHHYPTDAAGVVGDMNAVSLDEATTVALDAGRFLTDRIELRLILGSNVIARGTDDGADGPADTLGFYAFRSIQDLSRQSADLRTNVYVGPGVVFSGGVQLEQQDQRDFQESESQFGPSNGSSDEERTNRAYYAQALADVASLSFTVGGRIDTNEAFGTFVTYRAGAAYRVGAGTKVRGTVGRSFKAPTFFENFATGFVIGNPDLTPERSTGWEVGLDQHLIGNRIVMGATYFVQEFRDLIQYTFAEVPNYRNVARAQASGMEAEVTGIPIDALELRGHLSLLHTEVTDAGFDADNGPGAAFVQGQRLLRRPSTTFAVGASYTGWERGYLGVDLNYLGARDDRDFSSGIATPVVLPSATTLNAWGGARIARASGSRPALTATIRVENLFDEQYQTVVGFPARGRTVFFGVTMEPR
jgi:vitamin B12 transporter